MSERDIKGQTDVGYNTARRLWFLEYQTSTRVLLGKDMVKNNKLELKNVPMDTYSWPDAKNETLNHMRFRFYDGCDINTQRNSFLSDSITVKGHRESLKFQKVTAKDIEIKAKLFDNEWEIIADDKSYTTKQIIGITSWTFDDKPIRAYSHNQSFLYNDMVTIWGNTNLLTS